MGEGGRGERESSRERARESARERERVRESARECEREIVDRGLYLLYIIYIYTPPWPRILHLQPHILRDTFFYKLCVVKCKVVQASRYTC